MTDLLNLDAIRRRNDSYRTAYRNDTMPTGSLTVLACESADDVPGLLAELEALNTRRTPRLPCPMGAGCTVDHLPTSEGT